MLVITLAYLHVNTYPGSSYLRPRYTHCQVIFHYFTLGKTKFGICEQMYTVTIPLRIGLEPGSLAWESGALTRRLKTAVSVTRALIEIRLRFTCKATTSWPPLHMHFVSTNFPDLLHSQTAILHSASKDIFEKAWWGTLNVEGFFSL